MSEEKKSRSKFPPLFWLVVMFEFFERGSYYGMMSVLSVYMTDILGFAKTDAGIIGGVIQPWLYFLPIVSGALADRFGYRIMLMIAFSLLGGGYFLVAQVTDYAAVFLSLMVMGLGAGFFKPLISGTIARCTDKSNSTLGFGIFYWSINLGAFLFPTFLVPFLKNNIGWDWVIMASAIGTSAMLLPTIFAFREPPRPSGNEGQEKSQTNLLQTLANAFEIIYSPLVLLFAWMRSSTGKIVAVVAVIGGLLGYSGWNFTQPSGVIHPFAACAHPFGEGKLIVWGEPNLCQAKPYKLEFHCASSAESAAGYSFGALVDHPGEAVIKISRLGCAQPVLSLHLYNPDKYEDYAEDLLEEMNRAVFVAPVHREDLDTFRESAIQKTVLEIVFGPAKNGLYSIEEEPNGRMKIIFPDEDALAKGRAAAKREAMAHRRLGAIPEDKLDELFDKAGEHPFFLAFVGLMLACALIVLRLTPVYTKSTWRGKTVYMVGTIGLLYLIFWLLPGLALFSRILCSVLSITLLSLFAIDTSEKDRFRDHFRFLLMVVIYSGFFVMYFQMFGAVLWYVQAYVDPTSLNNVVNGALAALGLDVNWHFDVEYVTSINAGAIILLQLLVSFIVKNTKALPTMIVGIALGTIGMAILAISTGIWIFMIGITIFSIGEMTAHPKFISYVGQTAPKSRVAVYMGYLFLYGVFGSGIGTPMGANLYVKFVDELNQPRTLWLIFTAIGVATIVGLLLYNKFVTKKPEEEHGVTA